MNFSSSFQLIYACLLILTSFAVIHGKFECGGYIKTEDEGTSGTLSSPNYPANYTDLSRCIWLIEAVNGSNIEVTVDGMQGEEDCSDYLEITNGNKDRSQLYYACVNSTSVTVRSESRWIWIKFDTNNVNTNTGFSLSWYQLKDYNENNTITSPIVDCQSVHFRCPNRECVSWAYHCDGYYDCGCTESGCDEANCGGLDLSQGAIIGIGISVGVVTFSAIFLGIGFVEIYIKKRSEADYQKKVDDARRRARHKKKDGGDPKRKESHSLERAPTPASPSTPTKVLPFKSSA